MEVGAGNSAAQLGLEVLALEVDGDGLLLGIEEDLAKELGHEGENAVVAEEHFVLGAELATRLEWLEFAFQLVDADYSGDKLDVVLLQQILVLPLRVLGDQADGGSRRRWQGWTRQLAEV